MGMAKTLHEEIYRMEERLENVQRERADSHVHSDRCKKLFAHMLTDDEWTIMEVRQSYLASISPDRIIATSKRVIIVRPSFWGLWGGHNVISPTELSMVPYKNIISVVMSRGKIFSTIHMRIHGFTDASSAMRNEGMIEGIRHEDAVKLTNYLEGIIEAREDPYGAAEDS